METINLKSTLDTVTMVTTEAFTHSTQSDNTTYASGSDEVTAWANLVKILPSMFMCFIGVFGNVLALVILHIRPSKDSRSTAFFHLVKALAVVDLTGIVALSPVPIATHGQVVKAGGMALCAYFTFVISLAGYATLSIVAVMAGERFMVTKYPFQYPKVMSHRNLNIVIAVAWTTSALVSALPIMGVGRYSDRWPGTWCFFDFRDSSVGGYIASILFAGVGILIIVVTFVVNALVIHHLWSMRKSRLAQYSIRSSSHKGPDSEIRMVLFLLAIIIVFTLCYSPLMVRILINQFQNVGGVEMGGVDDRLDLWSIRLASFNQIIDPWIYIISRFTCCGARRKSSDTGRSPNKTAISTVSNSPSPKKSLIGRTVNHAKAFFQGSPNGEKRVVDNAMVMLNTEPHHKSTPMLLPPLLDVDKHVWIEKVEDQEPSEKDNIINKLASNHNG